MTCVCLHSLHTREPQSCDTRIMSNIQSLSHAEYTDREAKRGFHAKETLWERFRGLITMFNDLHPRCPLPGHGPAVHTKCRQNLTRHKRRAQEGTMVEKGETEWLRFHSLSNAGYEPDGHKKTNQDSFISIAEFGTSNCPQFPCTIMILPFFFLGKCGISGGRAQ
jgi:hypothetical protein